MSLLFNGRMTLTFNAHAIVSLYQRPENKEPGLLPATVLWALRRQRSFPVISDYSIPFWWTNEAGRKGGSERRKEGKKARGKKGARRRERERGRSWFSEHRGETLPVRWSGGVAAWEDRLELWSWGRMCKSRQWSSNPTEGKVSE